MADVNLNFPDQLDKQPFWMSFSFYQYSMPNVIKSTVNYTDKGTVRLPLPNSMVDDQHVQYAQESLGTVTGAAIGGLQSGTAGGVTAGLGIAAGFTAAQNVLNGKADKLAAAGLQSKGATANPFLTVMFKSPAFKQHAFEWKLTPSNKNESQVLNKIINQFRANMLPDQNNALGGTLLTYPNIVQLTVSVNDPTFFTYAFKPAVIESFSINFAPGGQPSFFGETKAPTEVTIRMGLMEIEYWLSSDYGMATTNTFGTVGGALNTLKSIFGA